MIALTYFAVFIKYLQFDSHEYIRLITANKKSKYATNKFDVSNKRKHLLCNPSAHSSEAIKSTNAYLSGK